MPVQFTTETAPGHRRLALWQDIVCDVFVGLDCKSDLGSAFHGSVTQAALGKAACSQVHSGRQRVLRTPSRIARSGQEFILVAIGNLGHGGVRQDGRETTIQPGQFALYDTTRPYELMFDDTFTQTIFKIPRDMLHRRIGGTEHVTATTLGGDAPVERLAHDFVLTLCQNAERLAPDAAASLSEQAADLLAMALSERLGQTPLPTSTHRSALLYRVKAHIRAHLADPELSLAGTAVALGISARYVNDLLADEDTSFQRYLLGERLAQCRRDLASPVLAHRHISEIAMAWGFNDLSHFGRVFRDRFGLSPREFRQGQSRH
jgi:AraC-like DNA-binding protein